MALSRFSRQVNANSFFYGGPGSDFPPALVVVAAPGVSGAQTVTTQGSSVAATDGTIFTPLSTNAPITIGTGANAETVTPSAVSNNVQSNLYGLSSTATATFANAHYPGDRIASGTFGLQEAINYLAGLGGGTVILDSAWVTNGGTTAIIQAAIWSSGVTLLDNRGTVNPAGPGKTSVVLTNTQILNMFTTAVQLLPPPGAGYFYNILKATVINENLGTAYAAGGAITIGYGTTPIQGLSGTIANTFLTTPTVTQVIQLAGVNLASTTEAQFDNAGIFINNASGAFTTGAGTLKCSLVYTVEAK